MEHKKDSVKNFAKIIFNDMTEDACIEIPYRNGLQIVKKAILGKDKEFVVEGDVIHFVIKVTNKGKHTIREILFKDLYNDDDLRYVRDSLTVNKKSVKPKSIDPVVYEIEKIESNEEVEIELDFKVVDCNDRDRDDRDYDGDRDDRDYDGDRDDGDRDDDRDNDERIINRASVSYDGKHIETRDVIPFGKKLKFTKTTAPSCEYVEANDVVHFILTVENPNKCFSVKDIVVEDFYDTRDWKYVKDSFEVNNKRKKPDDIEPLKTKIACLEPKEKAYIEFDLLVK